MAGSHNLRIEGLDAGSEDSVCKLDNQLMIWDTGARSTVITDDLFPQEFRDFLKEEQT
ncbi:hypothetical protein L228DRAFT_242481 [Xylona heveae TC161]|uniref:Peptidase A2 domain-containing protein n=1 Tax=Xylona heveae (strain CBS 132557 / TC161) TaxID=1328760 RepID=A0A165JD75_XYLHT|nr:hypothetical protein L228DRAFT_242481 [Xylona heveae TC161]KZF26080.1 hypothetical protein L228DRAFT_242481 [Xylona heveae TC161]